MHANEYQGPLAGLNVIDFGHYYAGPMAGMLLADQGANVIHIVRPGGPELPSQQYRLLNRNKKLLVLDLKTPVGVAEARSLIERADVVIENFRPGVMKRLGLGYASIKDSNPGLIYLSLPGFSPDDKERADIQAWEGLLNAATGLYHDLSHVRKHLNFPPVYSWVPLCSVYGATTGVVAVIAALLAREEHGIGTIIETPLVEAGQEGFGADYFVIRTLHGMYMRPEETQKVRDEYEVWEGGKENKFDPSDSPEVQEQKVHNAERAEKSTPFHKIYPCKDGRQILVFNVAPSRAINFFKGLGIYEQLQKEGFVHAGVWNKTLDNNLDVFALNKERMQRLDQLIAEQLLTRTAEEWENILSSLAPCCMVRTRDEWMALEPMHSCGVFAKMNNDHSELTVAGRFTDISGPGDVLMDDKFREPESITAKQAKNLLNVPNVNKRYDQEHIELSKGDLLKGLKVLDLSNGLAGPTSAFTLAQYGAEVICLQSLRMQTPYLLQVLLEVTQSKHSVIADLRTAPGQDILQRLVSWADVVVHNILDDTALTMGVSHTQLQEVNPDVVSCQVSCLGGPKRGYWEMRPGFDPIAQTVSGLEAHYGTLENPKEHGSTLTTDNLGGFGLAYAALLGLYQKKKTGYAGEGRCSLARVCNYIQLPYMISENGSSDWGEAHGQLAVGDHWWQRMYQCADTWIYVGTSKEEAKYLAKCVTGKEDAEEWIIETEFAKHDYAYWQSKLGSAAISYHRVMSVNDIFDSASIRSVDNQEAGEYAQGAGEILRWNNHPCGFPLTLKAPSWVRIGEKRSYKRLSPAPYPGQNSREVLLKLGYSEDYIDELIRLNVVSECIPQVGKGKYFLEGQK